jgi:hypothetical protein
MIAPSSHPQQNKELWMEIWLGLDSLDYTIAIDGPRPTVKLSRRLTSTAV